ncbi:hypothetical protein Thiowin_02260 [Thiorhodovibrio winogradskyi]|uniref:Uncharacterized protein n=1 Tax=Thiorhodovibrio winogradskyi TaxID=77007 RepID=A0ABZ0SAA9_9GAMM
MLGLITVWKSHDGRGHALLHLHLECQSVFDI